MPVSHRARSCFTLALAATIVAGAAPAFATPGGTLGYDDARHLLARTGFGPTDAEIRVYAPLTRAEAVDKLLRETRLAAVTRAAGVRAATAARCARPRAETATEAERKAYLQQRIARGAWSFAAGGCAR